MKHVPVFAAAVCIAGGWGFAQTHGPAAAPAMRIESLSAPSLRDEVKARPTVAPLLVVDVEGEVLHPGLHHVPFGARVAEAIAAAGGATRSADIAGVDRAEVLEDGKEIIVPAQDSSGTASGGPGGTSSMRHTSKKRHAHRRRHRRPSPEPSSPTVSVDLNHATAQELAKIPGLDALIAARIVVLRSVDGGFDSLEDLLDVQGVSEARLERLAPYVRFASS